MGSDGLIRSRLLSQQRLRAEQPVMSKWRLQVELGKADCDSSVEVLELVE